MSLHWKGVSLLLGGFSCVHLSAVIQWYFSSILWKNEAWCSSPVSVSTCWQLLNTLSNQSWQRNWWVLVCENRWVRKEGRPSHSEKKFECKTLKCLYWITHLSQLQEDFWSKSEIKMHTRPGFLISDGNDAFCAHRDLLALPLHLCTSKKMQSLYIQANKTLWCAKENKICPVRLKPVLHVLIQNNDKNLFKSNPLT